MRIETIESRIKLLTGLHIGGSDDTMKIGGIDSPVLKREVYVDRDNNLKFPRFDEKGDIENSVVKVIEPYIAGSSLKGKIRSLLEHYFRLINPTGEGEVVDSNTEFDWVDESKRDLNKKRRDLIVKLFGESAKKDNSDKKLNITRAIFRDCYITKEVRRAKIENKITLFEDKTENVINRVTGTAEHPRHIERVPSLVEFDFSLSIRVFEEEERELLRDTLLLGIKLLELDALGGSGSRGYGRVEFSDINESIEELASRVNN
jgi:CRISPR-associated protein Csm3